MEGCVEMQEEIRLTDVIKTLLRKIKLLVLALLIGIVVGGALGFAFDFNKNYYGGTVEFYVNPKQTEDETGEKIYGAYGQTAMNDMVGLLNSQLFAEYLFLDGDGLPETTSSEELNQKIDSLYEAITTYRDENTKIRIENTELKVENTKLELLKCNKPSCPHRQPPTGY